MKILRAFLFLVRFPNLLFIVLTQVLFYTCIFKPLLSSDETLVYNQEFTLFIILVLASILIAAGGYTINDYFDLKIDQVNKPDKVVVDRVIKRRWVIVWHWIFSLSGLTLSWMVSHRTGSWIILFANILCVLLLWFYSTHFKRQLLIGNIIISLLTAWVIFVVFFFAGGDIFKQYVWFSTQSLFDARKLFKLTVLYGGFAFIISMVREVVKDMEDMYGDAKFDCKTMPIVWGIPVSKMFTAVWLVVAIVSLTVVQFYAFHSARYVGAFYSLCLIIIPLGVCVQRLYRARTADDYHVISNYLKWIMLAGILSMFFFKFTI